MTEINKNNFEMYEQFRRSEFEIDDMLDVAKKKIDSLVSGYRIKENQFIQQLKVNTESIEHLTEKNSSLEVQVKELKSLLDNKTEIIELLNESNSLFENQIRDLQNYIIELKCLEHDDKQSAKETNKTECEFGLEQDSDADQNTQSEFMNLEYDISDLVKTSKENCILSYDEEYNVIKRPMTYVKDIKLLIKEISQLKNRIKELELLVDDDAETIQLLVESNTLLETNARELQSLIDNRNYFDNNKDITQEQKAGYNKLDKIPIRKLNNYIELEGKKQPTVCYEQTIMKLQSKIEQLRIANNHLNRKFQDKISEEVKMESKEYLNFKFKYAEINAFAGIVDSDLKTLEVQECKQYVNYLCAFMPDSFLRKGSDHDAILVLLLVFRMMSKCDILCSRLKEKFPCPKVISEHLVLTTNNVNRYSFSNRLLYQLYILQSVLHQFDKILKQCQMKLLLKFSSLYSEIVVQEEVLDFYIDLLRKDQLDENVNLDNFVKCVVYFLDFYCEHLVSENLDCTQFISDHMRIIKAACESIHTDISSIRILLNDSVENNKIEKLLTNLCMDCDTILEFVKIIRSCLPVEGSQTMLQFSNCIQNLFSQSRGYIGHVMNVAYSIRSSMQQVNATKSTNRLNAEDNCKLKTLNQSICVVKNHTTTLLNDIQKRQCETIKNDSETISPIYARAKILKEKFKSLEELSLRSDALEAGRTILRDKIKSQNTIKSPSENLVTSVKNSASSFEFASKMSLNALSQKGEELLSAVNFLKSENLKLQQMCCRALPNNNLM